MLAIGGSDSNAALFSFSFATLFLLTVLILFFYASRQEFYQHYSATAIVDSDSKQERDEEVSLSVNHMPCRRSCLTPGLGCGR